MPKANRFFFNEKKYKVKTYQMLLCVISTILIATCSGDSNSSGHGLSFQPTPPDNITENHLIWVKSPEIKYWTQKLDEFLHIYESPGLASGRGQNIVECDYDRPPKKGQVCDVNIKHWNQCTRNNHYSYHRSSPCIFLKLNLMDTFVPQYYNDTTELPNNMPSDLKEYIVSLKDNKPSLNTVWVSCEGENPADVENIGPIKYIPSRGFPGYFYPSENAEGYLSPLVAIHLQRPMQGIIINIECKVWAKNIKHDHLGTAHFEILLD